MIATREPRKIRESRYLAYNVDGQWTRMATPCRLWDRLGIPVVYVHHVWTSYRPDGSGQDDVIIAHVRGESEACQDWGWGNMPTADIIAASSEGITYHWEF